MADRSRSGADPFELLSDDVRLGIVEALSEAARGPPPDGMGFADLRRAVGVEDPGRFHYHLDRLTGRFVEQDDEERYRLTYAGRSVAAAVISGRFDSLERHGPERLDSTCPVCGGGVVATYEDGTVEVECADGDHRLWVGRYPPGNARDRSLSAVVELAQRRSRHHAETLIEGTCPMCHGEVTVDTTETEYAGDTWPLYKYGCERCWFGARSNGTASLLAHPAFVAFHFERGIDVTDRFHWEYDSLWNPDCFEVVSEDPYRLSIDVRVDGDVVGFTLDGVGDVIDHERLV